MEQSHDGIPDRGGVSFSERRRFERYTDLHNGVLLRQITTRAIPQGSLSFYSDAASIAGFKVTKIADEREEFPYDKSMGNQYGERRQTNEGEEFPINQSPEVTRGYVRRKGYVAVSVEEAKEPKVRTDFIPFWDKLKSLKKTQTSPSH